MFPFCRLSRRLVLLQQMESHLRDKDAEQTWHTQEADAAHKRNLALLNVSFHGLEAVTLLQNSCVTLTISSWWILKIVINTFNCIQPKVEKCSPVTCQAYTFLTKIKRLERLGSWESAFSESEFCFIAPNRDCSWKAFFPLFWWLSLIFLLSST